MVHDTRIEKNKHIVTTLYYRKKEQKNEQKKMEKLLFYSFCRYDEIDEKNMQPNQKQCKCIGGGEDGTDCQCSNI